MSDTQDYGSDIEVRVGVMADLDADPTAWQNIEGLSFDFMPNRARKERQKLGAPTRQNPLDPTKPRDGFMKGSASAKLDLDTRQLPLVLYNFLGDPISETGMGPYVHTWQSGLKDVRYGCVQVGGTSSKIRVYRGFLLEALTLAFTGENVQDFDLDAKFRWLSQSLSDDWLDGDVTAVPAEAPVNRGLYKVNTVAAANCLSGNFAWDRKIEEDAFLSTTATLAGLRPGVPQTVSGGAVFRDNGESFDTLDNADTVFASQFAMLGAVGGHEIDFTMPHCLLDSPPVSIKGPDLIERTIAFKPFQDATHAAAQIVVTNDIAAYIPA